MPLDPADRAAAPTAGVTVRVLQHRREIREARRVLERRGLDCRTSALHNALHRVGLARGARVGDRHKSWDLQLTIDFLRSRVPLDAPILDLGAYASELLPALHRLGYSALSGVDLDPRVGAMPHADRIRYVEADFLDLAPPARGYAAVTAISVLEHGFQADRLLAMLGRSLAPGGFLVASVDYWPEKVDTSGVRLFGLDWCVFSRDELEALFARAADFGLELEGDAGLDAREPTIRWAGRRYTFAWFVLRRTGP